jgi:LacI family transcriptional regulator
MVLSREFPLEFHPSGEAIQMSFQRVAELAGVSLSTVSRVVNEHPKVAPDTAAAVKLVAERLGLALAPRSRRNGSNGNGKHHAERAHTIAFLVFGTSGSNPTAGFEKLLRGVSDAAYAHDLSLVLAFVSNPGRIPPRLLERPLAGVLCHGDEPGSNEVARLQSLPTVWLMANRHRPRWGDQVMPNNAVIGDMAARYLVRRGHRRLAYLGADGGAWSMRLRCFAFAKAAEDSGVTAAVFEASAGEQGSDYWSGSDGLPSAVESRVTNMLASSEMPTGLFVAEDRLLPLVDCALRSRGVQPGRDLEVISCNNEQPHYVGLASQPARIDIRPEAIARRGVEQLLWRARGGGGDAAERIRVMIDPLLIEPDGINGAHVPQSADCGSAEIEVEVPITSERV